MRIGRIHLLIGPMYACKSSELIRLANRYKCIGKKVLAINHTINNRYGTKNISTHDRKTLDDCLIVTNLSELYNNENYQLYKNSDILIIEELQFYNDAYEFIKNAADIDNKIIICAGLDGDSNREPFGDVLRIIPLAEKVTKLTALCKKCGDGTEANFTQRIVKNTNDKIIVGSDGLYDAVCRYHYLNP
jgi:thymidine kinase